MKKILLISMFAFISCMQPEQKCADFHTGKFRFEHTVNGVKKVTVFERTYSQQIETYEGKTDTAEIRWVNDCEYVLRKLHPKNMAEKQSIDMKILTTSKNSYTFEFGIVGSENKQNGTVTKTN